MIIPSLRYTVYLQERGDGIETPILGAYGIKKPSATNLDDEEENAVRHVEQIVRQAFKKFRERGEDMRTYKDYTADTREGEKT